MKKAILEMKKANFLLKNYYHMLENMVFISKKGRKAKKENNTVLKHYVCIVLAAMSMTSAQIIYVIYKLDIRN